MSKRLSWPAFVDKTIQRTGGTEDFREWLMSKSSFGINFFDPFMYQYVYSVYCKVNNFKQDHFICIIGGEGTGKSTLAFQICALLDPNFGPKNLCYTVDEFLWWLEHGKPGQTVWLDEGVLFLFSRDALSAGNKNMVKLITLMRQRRLIVVICIPRFKDIESKVRTQRVDGLIRITKHANGRDYCLYFKRGAQIVSDCLQKSVPWHVLKVPEQHWFNGYFTNDTPNLSGFDWDEYEKIKMVAFLDVVKGMREQKDGAPTEYMTIKEAKTHFPVSDTTWAKMIRKGTVNGTKIGGRWMIRRDSLEKLHSADPESLYIASKRGGNA